MESRSIIGYDQSKAIIECFFKVGFDFDALLQRNQSKHPPIQIIEHVKGIFKKLLLDIEYELMIASKIKTMQLYENSSKNMFDKLMMEMQGILSEEEKTDFNIYYRNRVSKVTVYQTDLISSDKRMTIYTAFLNYAIENNLFKYSDTFGQSQILTKQISEDPNHIYSTEALHTIYQYFAEENGNLFKVQKKLKNDGMFIAPMYQGQFLKANLKNLQLIGLFRVYQTVMRARNKPSYPWKTFCQMYQPVIDKVESEWLTIFLRIAIFNDTKPEQRNQISKMIRRKFNSSSISSKVSEYAREREQIMVRKIKKEMKKIIEGDEDENQMSFS